MAPANENLESFNLINSDKPDSWKNDIAMSVDQFNSWFLKFAPETYQVTRIKTTEEVDDALRRTSYLLKITPEVLQAHPWVLSTLRMCTAPPLARDRLIGLAKTRSHLVQRLEMGTVPTRIKAESLAQDLLGICNIINKLLDRDLFPWLQERRMPSDPERTRASTIVADRRCSAVADPIIRNAQEHRQLALIERYLMALDYEKAPAMGKPITEMLPGTFTFRMNVPVGQARRINIPIDVVIQPKQPRSHRIPVLIEAKSAGDFTNTNKRRKEEATKIRQLRDTYGHDVQLILFLCGYFDSGYLAYEAAGRVLTGYGSTAWMTLCNWEFNSMNNGDLITAEADRLRFQAEIDSQKTLAERNKLGQFATPPSLAIEIARYIKALLDKEPGLIHFSDPALGTGAFFSALLSVFPREQIASASGIELDLMLVGCANDLWQPFGLQAIQGDFTGLITAITECQRPNLILTNPPYVRHHHLNSEQKRRLRALAARATNLQVNGLAGLYVYYLLISHLWLEDRGLAAWLIPSEFMDVNYGDSVKKYLTEQVTLITLHRFDPLDVQFEDALVSSAVVVFRKTPPRPGCTVRFTYGGTLERPKMIEEVPLPELKPSRKWSFYPMVANLEKGPLDRVSRITLADLFKIQRGIATGANEFFILSREKARSLGLPEKYLRPILPSPRRLRETIIERASDGYPKIDPQLAVVDCDLPEEALHDQYPALWAYLETAGMRGIRQRYLLRQREPWFKQEQRDPAPFLCTYMGRTVHGRKPFRFIWNRSDAIAPNVYLMLYPVEPLARIIRQRSEMAAAVLDLLNQITDQALKEEGRVYGGGLHKIEPRELGRIPARRFLDQLPDLGRMFPEQKALKFES